MKRVKWLYTLSNSCERVCVYSCITHWANIICLIQFACMHVLPGEKAPFSSGLFPTWPHNSFLTGWSQRWGRWRFVYLFQLLSSRLIFTLWDHLTPIVCRNTWQIAVLFRPFMSADSIILQFFWESSSTIMSGQILHAFDRGKLFREFVRPNPVPFCFNFPPFSPCLLLLTRIVCFENELNLKLNFAVFPIFTPFNAIVRILKFAYSPRVHCLYFPWQIARNWFNLAKRLNRRSESE